jgi:hypothetical protein
MMMKGSAGELRGVIQAKKYVRSDFMIRVSFIALEYLIQAGMKDLLE